MKKLFIIHRWDGKPSDPLYKWLEENIEGNVFSVEVPEMPNTEEPKIEEWISKLNEIVPLDEESSHEYDFYFIGHSIGCQAIMRFFERLTDEGSNFKAKKVVFIAPWLSLQGIEEEGEEVIEIAKPWIETPIDLEKVKQRSEKVVCIFSDNDYYVKNSSWRIFEDKLDAKIIIEKEKGHFTEDDGVIELKSALEEFGV